MAILYAYKNRKLVTISGSSGAGTNYQVLIKVGESSGAAGCHFHVEGTSLSFPNATNNGGDLAFTAADGESLLPFFVEKVEGTSPNRVAHCWVKVTANLDTSKDIYCYWGRQNAPNLSSDTNTFIRVIDGVVGSWHLNEGSGNVAHDTSGNGNHGTLCPNDVGDIEMTNCDSLTDWSGSDGVALSIDTTDKKEGTGCVKGDVSMPVIGTTYRLIFNPASPMDLGDRALTFWFKCDRDFTAFGANFIYIYDTNGNWRRYGAGFFAFSPNSWVKHSRLIASYGETSATPPDIHSIDRIEWQLTAADTIAFTMKVDYVYASGKAEWVNGKWGMATHHSEDCKYINVPNSTSLCPTEAISVETWVKKPIGWWGTGAVVRKGCDYFLDFDYPTRLRFGVNLQVNMGNFGYPDDGNWHHVVGTYDRVASKRYVDATLLGSTAYTDPINTSPNAVRIGTRDDLLESYNGYLDEVRIYNKALSADEISDLYNNYGYTTASYLARFWCVRELLQNQHLVLLDLQNRSILLKKRIG